MIGQGLLLGSENDLKLVDLFLNCRRGFENVGEPFVDRATGGRVHCQIGFYQGPRLGGGLFIAVADGTEDKKTGNRVDLDNGALVLGEEARGRLHGSAQGGVPLGLEGIGCLAFLCLEPDGDGRLDLLLAVLIGQVGEIPAGEQAEQAHAENDIPTVLKDPKQPFQLHWGSNSGSSTLASTVMAALAR